MTLETGGVGATDDAETGGISAATPEAGGVPITSEVAESGPNPEAQDPRRPILMTPEMAAVIERASAKAGVDIGAYLGLTPPSGPELPKGPISLGFAQAVEDVLNAAGKNGFDLPEALTPYNITPKE